MAEPLYHRIKSTLRSLARRPPSDHTKCRQSETWKAHVQDWDSMCMDDRDHAWDGSQYPESLDDEEIENEIQALLPAVKRNMQGEYCRVCYELPSKLDVLIASRNVDNVEVAHPLEGIPALEAGCLAGCRLCRLITQRLNPEDKLRLLKIENRLKLLGKPNALVLSFFLRNLYLGYQNIRGLQLEVTIKQFSKLEQFSPSVELPVLAATDSIKCAKQWLVACDESHPGCKPTSLGEMPTRLLFLNALADDAGDESLSVRLVETDNWTHRARYAALSHCWGRFDFIKLKHDTIDSFKSAIPFHQLTKTFKDAVQVTHFLGLQYLWIDSLCIIQDSKPDWEKEAARMSLVYSESYVTIAAAAAEDGTMGLFLKDLARVDAAIIPSRFSSVGALVADKCIHIQGVHDTTLSARAWVRQERLLSNRSIHFGRGDLFWECRSRDACESLPNGLPEDLALLNRRPRPPFHHDWQEIVESYSRCKLTFATDKLVALAGLACVASRASGDEYVAGMWRSKLLNMLSWHRDLLSHEDYLLPIKDDPKEYTAPTWSWASVDGPIQFVRCFGSSSPICSIVNILLTPQGSDEFGQLSCGTLTLGCPILLPGYVRPLNVDHTGGPGRGATQVKLSHNGERLLIANLHPLDYIIDANYDIDIVAVPIINEPQNTLTNELHSVFMLLLQATQHMKGRYRRIGLLKVYRYEPRWSEFCTMLADFDRKKAGELCIETRLDSETGNTQYVINIV